MESGDVVPFSVISTGVSSEGDFLFKRLYFEGTIKRIKAVAIRQIIAQIMQIITGTFVFFLTSSSSNFDKSNKYRVLRQAKNRGITIQFDTTYYSSAIGEQNIKDDIGEYHIVVKRKNNNTKYKCLYKIIEVTSML